MVRHGDRTVPQGSWKEAEGQMERKLNNRQKRRKLGTAQRRRGAVAAQVAVSMATLCGFAALSVDVGMMYHGRTELQRTVDAAALAGAAVLGSGDHADAVNAVFEYAEKNSVLGKGLKAEDDQYGLLLSQSDIVFGRAYIDQATQKYIFEADDNFPNAVKVTARRPAPLFFANVFGMNETELAASATAVLTPRDIALVADLSLSHNWDTALKDYRWKDINIYEVWTHLPKVDDVLSQTDGLGFTSVVDVVDNGDGTSTVIIELTSDGDEGTAALSHLTMGMTVGIPEDAWAMAAATASSTGDYPVEIGEDPTTGVSGLKFDETELGEDGVIETQTFSFSIPNEYLQELEVATKAGSDWSSVNYNMLPGPTFGMMNNWGTETINYSYRPQDDPGLIYLPFGQDWNDAWIEDYLASQGYSNQEIDAITSGAKDSSGEWYGQYPARVAVVLGLAHWRSGLTGGRWALFDEEPGNNNTSLGISSEWSDAPGDWSNELTWTIEYPYGQPDGDGRWKDYIDYVSDRYWNSDHSWDYYRSMIGANSNFKCRFGLKTFTNYLLEQMYMAEDTPELADTPHQPMQAVKDATLAFANKLVELDGDDILGLVGYDKYGRSPAQHPEELSWLTANYIDVVAKMDNLQAGHWERWTNIAQGIDRGVDILFDEDHGARSSAAKVMILLTDGDPNRRRYGAANDPSGARQDTLDAAQDARDEGVQIYAVSVGQGANTNLMNQVAEIGGGKHWYAGEEAITYSTLLSEILREVGSERTTILID